MRNYLIEYHESLSLFVWIAKLLFGFGAGVYPCLLDIILAFVVQIVTMVFFCLNNGII